MDSSITTKRFPSTPVRRFVKHTQRLNDRRITRGEDAIVWKYFQYLTLLFTEIYLDRYFRDPLSLLKVLNTQVAAYNADKTHRYWLASHSQSTPS